MNVNVVRENDEYGFNSDYTDYLSGVPRSVYPHNYMVDDNGTTPRKGSTLELSSRRESIADFYRDNRLEHVGSALDELGVRTTADLAEITDDDLVAANLRPLEARRLRTAVNEMSKNDDAAVVGGGAGAEEEVAEG